MYNVTSIKEANAIIGALEDIKNAMEGGYPEPTSATDGQVLTADGDGGASWEDASGVDMTGAQAGQVLTAIEDMGGNLIQGWTTPDSGLPTITSSDNGKVLTSVYDDKAGTAYAEWQTPSSGGGNVSVCNESILSWTQDSSDYYFTISGSDLPSYVTVFSIQIHADVYGVYKIVPVEKYIYQDKNDIWLVYVSGSDYSTYGLDSNSAHASVLYG